MPMTGLHFIIGFGYSTKGRSVEIDPTVQLTQKNRLLGPRLTSQSPCPGASEQTVLPKEPEKE